MPSFFVLLLGSVFYLSGAVTSTQLNSTVFLVATLTMLVAWALRLVEWLTSLGDDAVMLKTILSTLQGRIIGVDTKWRRRFAMFMIGAGVIPSVYLCMTVEIQLSGGGAIGALFISTIFVGVSVSGMAMSYLSDLSILAVFDDMRNSTKDRFEPD